jgi:hypothetical protein
MRHKWKELFAKESFKLRHGIDYTCPRSSMPQQIRNAACRHGKSVRIKEGSKAFTVHVMEKTNADA